MNDFPWNFIYDGKVFSEMGPRKCVQLSVCGIIAYFVVQMLLCRY